MCLSRLIRKNGRIQIRDNSQKTLQCKLKHNISNQCEMTETGWNPLSEQHMFLTALSSESSTEGLSHQHAPASFVKEALVNPIRMIRQSGKLIDTIKPGTDDYSFNAFTLHVS